MKIYRNAKGDIKFYSTFQYAWKVAAKLNQQDPNASWLFQQDDSVGSGWFLFQDED